MPNGVMILTRALTAFGALFTLLISFASAQEQGAKHPNAQTHFADQRGRPLVQVGPHDFASYTYQAPFINFILQDGWKQVRFFPKRGGGGRMNFDELRASGHIDLEKDAIVSLPGPGGLAVARFRNGLSDGVPSHFFDTEWILEFDGDGDFALISPDKRRSMQRVGRNRYEISFEPEHRTHAVLRLTRVGKSPIRNIRLYEKRYEAQLNAGVLFRPEFIERFRGYDVVRPMDWNRVNSTLATRTDDLATVGQQFYGDRSLPPYGLKGGLPLVEQVRFANDLEAALWVNVPPMLGLPDEVSVEEILQIKGDPKGTPNRRTVGDKFALAGARAHGITNNNEYDRYAEQLFDLLTENGYPEDRPIYVELGNEIWNWSGGFSKNTGFYAGLSNGIWPDDNKANWRTAYGYLTGKLAVAFEKAAATRGQSREFIIVLATHTHGWNATKLALDGVDRYFQDHDTTAKARLAPRIGLATTNYYSGVFHRIQKKNPFGIADKKAYFKVLESAIAKDRNAVSSQLADWLLSNEAPKGIPALINTLRDQRDEIEAWGGFYLGNYEGGNHDVLRKSGSAVVDQFAEEWLLSDDHARVHTELAHQFYREFPDAMLANYAWLGKPTRKSPWIDGLPGVPNPYADSWKALFDDIGNHLNAEQGSE
ncbi:MAG: hypothetical protein AAFR03_00210 [Pseudomonadota bacterium]